MPRPTSIGVTSSGYSFFLNKKTPSGVLDVNGKLVRLATATKVGLQVIVVAPA